LAELEEYVSPVTVDCSDDLPSREEVETLVGRLEQLLMELEQSDERISTMTELLRVSDEANVASQEELAQMESWIGEVERRVREWEDEWHAERDVMEKTIDGLTAERDRAESRSGAPDQAELIQELREHAQSLQARLQQTQAERDDLNKRLEAADVTSIEEQVAAAVEVAMREERLQISQAKAEYARERADLAKQREELTSRESLSLSEPDIADVRIRAFREHLKEIRDTEPNGRPAPSLSQRLGKLWRKIDGKPLDTD
jgi:chromosome segregation ATPase